MREYFRRKVFEPLMLLLKQGLSPQKLALSLALGFVIGHFPVYGTTTTICALVALGFRLNLPAIQLANYLALPTQLALIIPFIDLGSLLFGPKFTLSIEQFTAAFEKDWMGGLEKFAFAVVQGMIGWGIIAPFIVLLLYAILLVVLRKFSPKKDQQSNGQAVGNSEIN